MAKYDPIWNHLKLHGTVSLAIARPLQARVIKGVIHAKDHDLIRKMELADTRKWEKLEYVQEHSKVTMKLVIYDDLKDIAISEL